MIVLVESVSLVGSTSDALFATTSMNNPDPKQISVYDKGQIIGLHRSGKSTKEVSEMTAIVVKTVHRKIAQ